MNNNILRTRKVKSRGQITAAAEHNFRTRMQVNIDPTRTHLNQILVNTLNVDTTKASDLQQKLTAYYQSLDIKEKKDNVLMLEFMISASPEFFTGKSPAEVKQWAKEQVKFMQKEFGDQLKIAVLHLDEKTPHLHFMVGTEVKSVKKYKNQKGEFFKETWSLNAKRYNPIFLRDLHDRHAEHNKNAGYDLKRGVRGSMRTHTSLKEFYDLVDKALGANYDKTIEKTIQSLELGLFTKQVTIAEIREKFKPMVNTMLKQNKALKTKFELDIKKWATSLSVEKDRQELENARITAENEILNKRRELYAEAINKSIQDSLLIQQQQETIARLTDEVKKLTPAQQPKIVEIKQNQNPTPF
jgi:uncharacterized coiled-coil protein SlyX